LGGVALDQYLGFARNAELRAITAVTSDDEKAWLEIAEAWRRIATAEAQRGGNSISISDDSVLDVQRRHFLRVDAKLPFAHAINRHIAQPDDNAGSIDGDVAKRGEAHTACAIDRDRLRDSESV
jgi:hypothetical protein